MSSGKRNPIRWRQSFYGTSNLASAVRFARPQNLDRQTSGPTQREESNEWWFWATFYVSWGQFHFYKGWNHCAISLEHNRYLRSNFCLLQLNLGSNTRHVTSRLAPSSACGTHGILDNLHHIPAILASTSQVPRPFSRVSYRSLAGLWVSLPEAAVQFDYSSREIRAVCPVWPR